MRVCSLGSGSSGNAIYVESGYTRILIDAGLPIRHMRDELKRLGVMAGGLSGIFLTHEHTDHVRSSVGLAERFQAPIYANAPTLGALGLDGGVAEALPTGCTLELRELAVTSLALPHDGVEPVGYLITSGQASVVITTDLGYLPEAIKPLVRQADLVVLESNHDVGKLLSGPYPGFLKSRVLSDVGHLSNEQAALSMATCVSGRSQRLWLAHLSAINNCPSLAKDTMQAQLRACSIDSVTVEVLPRRHRGPVWDSDAVLAQRRLL